MSKLETNTIDNISGSSTLTIGDSNASTISIPKNITLGASGTTITVPSGATITNNGTQTGFGGTNTPAFLAYNNSADTISNSSYTKVEFDTEVYDTASAFDTTNDKFVVPSGQGGYYTLYGVVNARNTSNQLRTIQIIFYKNGSRISSKYDFASVNNSDSAAGIFRGFSLGHTITVNLSASDYIEVYTYLTVSAGSPMVDEGSIFGGYKLIT